MDMTGGAHSAVPEDGDATFVEWSAKYDTGVDFLDRQHRELVGIVNRLYGACLHGGGEAEAGFRDAMSRMVEYVRFHFASEVELMEKIGFPDIAGHRKQHDALIRDILGASHGYCGTGSLAGSRFVRTLRDWVLGHIAVYDTEYANFVAERRRLEPAFDF